MNLDLVQKELTGLQKKTSPKREKIDYSKILWKPTEGKHQIRFVPSKFDSEMPFKEVFIHYGLAKYPIYALTNWGEDDPIIQFVEKLKSTGDKEDYALGYKLNPKKRYFAPVLVRDEENKGIRLWEFGVNVYKQLLGLASDEEVGDFTDPIDGRDFNVVGEKTIVGNRDVITARITPRMKSSPITEDSELLEKYLNEQPDILEVQIKFSYDKIKEVLETYLNPDGESEIVEEGENGDEMPWDKELYETPTEKGELKAPISKRFDNLFDKK